MSWQDYVDKSLLGSGTVDKAAIYSAEGNSIWAASSGFTLLPEELKVIVAAYKDEKDPKDVQSTGLHVKGEKYIVIYANERSLYGKKGKEGVIIVKTNLTILIAHYPETIQPGQATTTVEALADYLIKTGY